MRISLTARSATMVALLAGAMTMASGPAASSEEAPLPEGAGGSFGLGLQDHWVLAAEFSPLSNYLWLNVENLYYGALSPSGTGRGVETAQFVAQVELPTGAKVELLQCLVHDGDLELDAEILFGKHTYDHGAHSPDYTLITTVESSGGAGYQTPSQAVDETVRYRDGELSNVYSLIATLPVDQIQVRFRGCRFIWSRQISPPPGAATFGDVPTGHPFFQHVEALVQSGITAGCGSGNFCPNAPLTRGQMAVFLARALGLHWQF